jgi:single-stranded DNA-binding protein
VEERKNIEEAGELVSEPRLRRTGTGEAVCDMRANLFNEGYERFEMDLCVFGPSAETCASELSKGDEVEIDGKLRFRVWSDRRGRRHQGFSILARRVERSGAASSWAAVRSRRPAATVTRIGARIPTKAEQRQLFSARARLRASVPMATYKLWIRPLRLGGITADAVHLVAPDGIRTWVERRYSGLIAGALRAGELPESVSFASERRGTDNLVAAGTVDLPATAPSSRRCPSP